MTREAAVASGPPTSSAGSGARQGAARDRLAGSVLNHLLDGGSPDASLRSFASAVGVGHSLLLYHFGSTAGLLSAVHLACEQRERDHLAALRVTDDESVRVMHEMWQHLADPRMWPVYRLGFALRLRADVATEEQDSERDAWVAALQPLLGRLGVEPTHARDEALLWVATCRGLLWELVTGADPKRIHRAANRFFTHYDGGGPRR